MKLVSSLNDTVIDTDYLASSGWMMMNNELERKETVVASYSVLCQQLPGAAEENHKNHVRIVGDLAKIQTSTSQIQMSHLAWS
jgi:hypothetical protein